MRLDTLVWIVLLVSDDSVENRTRIELRIRMAGLLVLIGRVDDGARSCSSGPRRHLGSVARPTQSVSCVVDVRLRVVRVIVPTFTQGRRQAFRCSARARGTNDAPARLRRFARGMMQIE